MDRLEQRIAQALMEDAVKVEIRNAGVFRFCARYRFERHNHKEIEIIYIKSGHCIIGSGEKFVPLREGDCIILYRGVPHWFFVDKKESCQIAQLEFTITVPEYLKHALAFFEGKQFCKLSGCDMAEELIESISRLHRLEQTITAGSGGPGLPGAIMPQTKRPCRCRDSSMKNWKEKETVSSFLPDTCLIR